MEKDEIKTGKGWLELSREIPVVQAGPIKLEDLKKMLEEEAKQFLNNPKNKKYFK